MSDRDTDQDIHVLDLHDNVFAQLGCADTNGLLLRAQLMLTLTVWVKAQRLGLRKVARSLGVRPGQLRDLRKGLIDRFSLELLVRMLARAGFAVDVAVTHEA